MTDSGCHPWENSEEIDFHIKSATSADGTIWLSLRCSACGNVQATADGEASDLGYLTIAAQRHFERKHLYALCHVLHLGAGDGTT